MERILKVRKAAGDEKAALGLCCGSVCGCGMKGKVLDRGKAGCKAFGERKADRGREEKIGLRRLKVNKNYTVGIFSWAEVGIRTEQAEGRMNVRGWSE